MKNKISCTIILMLFLLGSCETHREADIVGKYRTSYKKDVVHELIISSDHTYTQILQTEDTIIKRYGSWNLDKDGDLDVTQWIDLNDFGNKSCYPDPCSSLLFVDGVYLKKNESDIDIESFKKME